MLVGSETKRVGSAAVFRGDESLLSRRKSPLKSRIFTQKAGRFNDDALRDQLQSPDKWLELLRVSGTPVGYCGYELSREDPDALKLGQLYVLKSRRGKGLGRFMLGYVENRAREWGRQTLTLQVNKRNTGAIAFYRRAGFEVVREAVFDIGAGFVMDDYVMAKEV